VRKAPDRPDAFEFGDDLFQLVVVAGVLAQLAGG